MLIVQFAPLATLGTHVFVCEKSPVVVTPWTRKGKIPGL
jgi:hypothetical protein